MIYGQSRTVYTTSRSGPLLLGTNSIHSCLMVTSYRGNTVHIATIAAGRRLAYRVNMTSIAVMLTAVLVRSLYPSFTSSRGSRRPSLVYLRHTLRGTEQLAYPRAVACSQQATQHIFHLLNFLQLTPAQQLSRLQTFSAR